MRRRSLSQRTSAYVVSTFAVFLVVIASLIGASTAAAQSGGGGGNGPPVKTKDVTKFIKHKTVQAYRGVPTVFPNSQLDQLDRRDLVDGGDLYLDCDRALSRRPDRPRWTCDYSIYFYEVSRSNPDQRTLRSCNTPSRPVGASGEPDYSQLRKRSPTLYVERAPNSKKLRILGGWRMTCAIDEQSIGWWNETGTDYYPDVSSSEATPYEVVDYPVDRIVEPRDDLLPAPSGTPGPAPGPGGFGPPAKPAMDESSHAKSARGLVLSYCTNWQWTRFSNGTYAVFSCFFNEQGFPDAALNVFANNTFYTSYYWTGRDYRGDDNWRMFQAGYICGPVSGSAYPSTRC